MSAETTLYARLSGVSGVTSLVSTRIYPDVLPENCTYPAVVFARSNTEPMVTLGGALVASTVSIAIGAWAKTRTTADAVADAVVAAFVGTDFYLSGREAAYDPETGLYAALLTVGIVET